MTDITELARERLKEKFDAWFEHEYKHLESSKYTDAVPHIKYGFWTAYQAGGAELVEALEKAQQRIDELVLAAMDSMPVAEVVSIYGDPEAFGEREIRPLVGIQQMPYGTKLYRHAQRPVVPNEITSASAPEVFEVAAEAERLGLRGTYASYAVGCTSCHAAMLAAAQQEVQVVSKKIEQSRKRVNRCDVCTEGARGGCGTCIFNGNFE